MIGTRATGTNLLETASRWMIAAAAIAVLVAPLAEAQQTGTATSPQELFGQAMHQETAMGDLSAAIALYERVVAHASVDPTMRLQAELRLAALLGKTGDTAAARALLVDIVAKGSSGPADAEIVEAARGLLALIGAPTAAHDEPRELPHPDAMGSFVWDTSADGRLAGFISYGMTGVNAGVFDYQSREITWVTEHTYASGWMAGFLAFAPEGTRVAYTQQHGSGAWELRVAVPGEESTLVRRFESDQAPRSVQVYDWLPNAETLVCAVQQRDGTGAIALVGLDGSFTQLRSQPWDGGFPVAASTDGKWIATHQGDAGRRDVFILAVDGSSSVQVTDHPSGDHDPFWSADGRHVLFTSDRNGTPSLWAREVIDGKPIDAPILVQQGLAAAFVTWVGDEMHYMASRNLKETFTFEVDPETGEIVAAPKLVPYPKTGNNILPEWSPDGSEIAFVRGPRRAAPAAIVVQPMNGDPAREFTVHEDLQYPVTAVRWTPDGEGLSYTARGRSGGKFLSRVDLQDGSQTTMRLNDDYRDYSFEWSADGSSFYYVKMHEGPTPWELIEHDVRSGGERVLRTAAQPGGGIRAPMLSPDGSSLLMGDSERVVIHTLETGQVRVLTPDWRGAWATWSPDGRFAVFTGARADGVEQGNREPRQTINIVDMVTGEVKPLDLNARRIVKETIGVEGGETSFYGAFWSPVDNRIAFSIQTFDNPRMALANPLPAALEAAGRR